MIKLGKQLDNRLKADIDAKVMQKFAALMEKDAGKLHDALKWLSAHMPGEVEVMGKKMPFSSTLDKFRGADRLSNSFDEIAGHGEKVNVHPMGKAMDAIDNITAKAMTVAGWRSSIGWGTRVV
jgi:hypothetical protein